MKKKPAILSTRPPLERMMRIHNALTDGKKANCSDLAHQLEVSSKTVMRDIHYMRERLNLPIEYEPSEFRYRYTRPVHNFPTINVSEGELFAIMVACKVLDQYKGTPYEKDLKAAFSKITESLKSEISFSPETDQDSFSFSRFGQALIAPEIYKPISNAVLHCHEVSFSYKKITESTKTQRKVWPYHLTVISGMTYLIGLDLGHNKIRQFALTRIQEVKVSPKTFRRPSDFDPEKYLHNNFGAFHGSGDFKVRILFAGNIANLILERHWHPTQKIRELKKGLVELSLQLNDLEAIANWLLTWGDAVASVEPPALLRLIEEKTHGLCARYLSKQNTTSSEN